MNAQEIHDALKGKFGEAITGFDAAAKSPFVVVDRSAFGAVMPFLRDEASLGFDLLLLVTGLDYPMHFVAVYHLASTRHLHGIAVKVELPRDNPSIASMSSVWPAADWHERETFDLLGIQFEGHPNLRRILCPEDWEGYPLRKDYVQPEEYHGISNVRQIGDDCYPKPDEDSKAILQYKPPKPPAAPKPAAKPEGESPKAE